jgi:hypothetical protein
MSAPTREQSGQRREEGAIGGAQRRATLLPREHDQLMPQDEQLDVLGELAAPAAGQRPEHGREGEISEGKEHAPDAPIARDRAQEEQERRSCPR